MGFRLDNQSDSGATGASFQDGLFQVVNSGDATKRFKIDLSGATTGTTTYFLFNQTANRNITFFDATDTVVGKNTTDILTNKTMSGASNTFTNIPLTTAVTGVLPIANGGTNSSTALNNNRVIQSSGGKIQEAAAITASRMLVSDANGIPVAGNATTTEANYVAGVTSAIQTQLDGKILKSILSAKGSLVGASAASTPADVTVGANGLYLRADSSKANGVDWLALKSVSKTGNYTATIDDDYIYCDDTSASFTITLYAASGNSGRMLRIIKTNATLANSVTIDGNASETINGATTTTINTQYEMLTIVCDGSNWFIVERQIPQANGSYTPTGTWSATYTGQWTRERKFLSCQIKVLAGGAVTGTFSASLPSGLAIDTAWLIETGSILPLGQATFFDNSGGSLQSRLMGYVLYSTTTVVIVDFMLPAAAAAHYLEVTNATNPVTVAASDQVVMWFKVPISGWNG